MVTKRVMASCLAIAMVLGMSLTSFAADVQPAESRNVVRVNLSDFQRLLNVCNEKYGPFEKTTKDKDLKGEYIKLSESLKVDANGNSVGVVEPVGPDPEGKGKEPNTSIHDFASAGTKICFENGKRLSATEFVIRVKAQDESKKTQTFAGDYYVHVIPYETKTKYNEAGVPIGEEAINVPQETSEKYGNRTFGPAWFYCKLFDDKYITRPVIEPTTGEQKKDEKGQPVFNTFHNTVGYLVAQRITRWPDKDNTAFYYEDIITKNGERVASPTLQARNALEKNVPEGSNKRDVALFPNVALKYGIRNYDNPSKDDWYENLSSTYPEW